MSIKCQLGIFQVYQVSTSNISGRSSVNSKKSVAQVIPKWSIKCQLLKKCCTSDPKVVDHLSTSGFYQVSTPKKVLHK